MATRKVNVNKALLVLFNHFSLQSILLESSEVALVVAIVADMVATVRGEADVVLTVGPFAALKNLMTTKTNLMRSWKAKSPSERHERELYATEWKEHVMFKDKESNCNENQVIGKLGNRKRKIDEVERIILMATLMKGLRRSLRSQTMYLRIVNTMLKVKTDFNWMDCERSLRMAAQ
ncbi:hypothetical protein BJ742DRAFT_740839 [Cladochytrium replicatum]|nr:hypothetical protein BJ742DRAFT_740839 [Cladochytrium replicatum]